MMVAVKSVDAETKEKKETEEGSTAAEAAAAPPSTKPKPKPAAKAPAKPLPQLMEEDVIPSLQTTLQAQDDISELELFFNDNTVNHNSAITFRVEILYTAVS